MSQSGLFRLGAGTLLLSGLFIILKKTVIELLLPVNVVTYSAGTFAAVLGLFGLTALYIYQREALGRFGGIAYFINWFGLALACGVEYARNYIFPFLDQASLQALLAGPTRAALLGTSLTFLIGVILFGIAMLRAGVFPRPAIILYMVGFVPYGFGPLLPDLIVRIGQITAAVSIIWLGYALWVAVRQMVPMKLRQAVGA